MNSKLEDNYAATFIGRLGIGASPALILVDFVQAYFVKDSPLYADVGDALASAKRVLEVARECDIPVIFTNVVYEPGGADGGVFYRKLPALKVFDRGSPLGAWADGLMPLDGEIVISKQYPSAFFGTPLARLLHEQKIDTVLITGVTTSGCIRATCVDAMCHGFAPIIIEDACGDRHAKPHAANLFDMQAKYADVMTERDVIEHLKALK